jgi:hypothetical protein
VGVLACNHIEVLTGDVTNRKAIEKVQFAVSGEPMARLVVNQKNVPAFKYSSKAAYGALTKIFIGN